MPRFLETEIREQQKYEKRIQTSVDNTADDPLHEIKFAYHVKNFKKLLFIKEDISLFLFLEKNFFKIPKNSVASAFFLPTQILKNIEMPRQNPRHLPNAVNIALAGLPNFSNSWNRWKTDFLILA